MQTIADIAPPTEPILVPVLVDDEDGGVAARDTRESRAEEAREAAMQAEHNWPMWDDEKNDWVPTRLQPLSLDRWTAWHGMALHHIPIPSSADLGEHIDAKVPSAWSMLYLMSHSPEHLLALLPNPQLYWYAVHTWAAIHCPGERWLDALRLMIQVRDETTTTIATPRPTGKASPRGNAPAPSRGQ